MASISLADLHHGRYDQVVCVRGGLDRGPIKLMYMVVIDEQGNAGYAIVPTAVVRAYLDVLHEGGVYQLSSFIVSNRPHILNPVASPFMIVFGHSTGIQPQIYFHEHFPAWTYRLISLQQLPSPSDVPDNFIDVIGVIRAISPTCTYQAPGTRAYIVKRCLLLSDCSGHTVKITLWGEAAVRCNAESICMLGQEEAAVAIFVGTTVRIEGGIKELSGKGACRWYVNEDLSEINTFRSSLLGSFTAITRLPAPSETLLRSYPVGHCAKSSLDYLLNYNFYRKKEACFRCNVKIVRMTPGAPWWYTCCTLCSRRTFPATSSFTQPDVYKCSDDDCSCNTATLAYRLCLIGQDKTGEAEFTLYGKIAEQIVGLPALQVLDNNRPVGSSIRNIHVAATMIRHIPDELSRLFSMRCKFIVRISEDSFNGRWPSLHVKTVEALSTVQ